MKRITSFLLVVCMIFSLSSCGKKTELKSEPEMTFAEFDWPKSDIAKMIPIPKSNVGYISWEASNGFVIYVAETSKEEYKDYVDSCWDKGFTNDYRRGDDFFWGDDEAGYSVHIRFEENDVMWIRMDAPEDESVKNAENGDIHDSIESASGEQNNTSEIEKRTVEVGGIRFYYPGYFDVEDDNPEDGILYHFYPSPDEYYASLMFIVDDLDVTKDEYISLQDACINSMISTLTEGGKEILSVEDRLVSDQPATIVNYTDPDNEGSRSIQAVIYYDKQLISPLLIYDYVDISGYDYIGDFYKMIENAEVMEVESEPGSKPIQAPETESDSSLTDEQKAIIQDIINGINSTDEKPSTLYYSTNTLEEAKKGNSGAFSYKRSSSNYDIYWIINFNNGYAYWFTHGNGNATCERVRIDDGDGDLNSYITVTYHDGDDSWQYGLCFKRARQPDRLIQSEEDGTQYEFIATDFYDALDILYELEIVDY